MQVIFFSLTGQTRSFIKKLNLTTDPIELSKNNATFKAKSPFILITPTYAENQDGAIKSQSILDPVFTFMKNTENAQLCTGIIGSGNRNFGETYMATAHELAKTYGIPIIYNFEMSGMQDDVNNVNNLLTQ